MPDHPVLLLLKGEIGSDHQVKLGEIEIIFLSFIPEDAQQPAVQRNEINLRPAAADIKNAVLQQLPGLFASQAAGGEPDPGRSEIPAPVLIRVSEAFFRRDRIPPAAQGDRAAVSALHAFRMPVHGKGLRVPERLAGPVTHIKSDLFVDHQVPGHLPGVAHPFRMRGGFLRKDPDAALQRCFAGQAVCRFDPVRRVSMERNLLPGKEPVQLTMVLSPGAGLDHQVGRELSGSLVLRQLAEDRLIFRKGRIAGEELNKKRLVLSGFRILRREGMPPPVISAVRQGTVEHESVPGNVVMTEHGLIPPVRPAVIG